jgi:serine/threonine protein kinase
MEEHKNKKEFIPMNKIKTILQQLFTGLKYVHSKSKIKIKIYINYT